MSELTDRIPGEVILSSFHNSVKDRTMMRYLNLAAIQASIPIPDPGDFGYLTEQPWPLTGDELGDGQPVVWAEDVGDTSPFAPGFRWSQLISDRGGDIFGPLLFRSGVAGGEGAAAPAWRVDVSGGTNFRIRSLNHPDGLPTDTWLQFSGAAGGGSNFIRMPATGDFVIRERDANTARVSWGPAGVVDAAATIRSARQVSGMAVMLQTGTDSNQAFASGDLDEGPIAGMVTRVSTVGANVAITDIDGDSNIDGVFWLPSQDLFSSDTWVGSSLWNMNNGRAANRLDRYTGSLAAKKKNRAVISRVVASRTAGVLTNVGPLLNALKDIDVEAFQFKVDAVDASDPIHGQFVPGFIADDLHAIDPRLCTYDWELDEDGNRVGDPILRGVNQNVIIPLAVLKIQELEDRLETLEAP